MSGEGEKLAEALAAALSELDEGMAAIGGCSDGYCQIKRPVGMHTNGGCRCLTDRHKATRFAGRHNRFVAIVRATIAEHLPPTPQGEG